MNAKQIKSLRKAIKQQYPNADESVIKKLVKEGKKQFSSLSHKEKGADEIHIK
jgi:hypothetical protein